MMHDGGGEGKIGWQITEWEEDATANHQRERQWRVVVAELHVDRR
jgi:hypothetical protein